MRFPHSLLQERMVRRMSAIGGTKADKATFGPELFVRL